MIRTCRRTMNDRGADNTRAPSTRIQRRNPSMYKMAATTTKHATRPAVYSRPGLTPRVPTAMTTTVRPGLQVTRIWAGIRNPSYRRGSGSVSRQSTYEPVVHMALSGKHTMPEGCRHGSATDDGRSQSPEETFFTGRERRSRTRSGTHHRWSVAGLGRARCGRPRYFQPTVSPVSGSSPHCQRKPPVASRWHPWRGHSTEHLDYDHDVNEYRPRAAADRD